MTDQEADKLVPTEPNISEVEVLNNDSKTYPDESDLGSHLEELDWRNAFEIVADAAHLIPGGFGESVSHLLKASVGLGKYSPKERLKDRQFQWLLDSIVTISEKVDRLLKELPVEERPKPADVASVMEAAIEVSRKTADAKKRKLLTNAVKNAFDREQYQTGLTLRFFSILKDVEYGDVYLLRKLANKPLVNIPLLSISDDRYGLAFHHLDILHKQGLVLIWNYAPNQPLSMNSKEAHTGLTELGKKFLKFLADTDTVDANV
jgi:hypothetical protein